jgi:Tol biopolymer transport system component
MFSPKTWGRALGGVAALTLLTCNAAAGRPKSLRAELEQAQAKEGLSLLTVDRGAVWRLDFRTGKLRLLARLPAELATFPEDWDHLKNHSLNWKEQKLAGMGGHGLFVANLAGGKVRWYRNVLGSHRMSLSNRADRVAFQSYGWVYVVDLATGKTTEVAAGMNRLTTPQWSPDDGRLVFHRWKPSERIDNPAVVMLADLKAGRTRALGEGEYATWVPTTGEVTLGRLGPWHTPFSHWAVSPEGGKARRVLVTDQVTKLLRYTPDGRYAVYERGYRWDVNIKGYLYGEVAVARLADKKSVTVYGPYKFNTWTRGNNPPLTWATVNVRPPKK